MASTLTTGSSDTPVEAANGLGSPVTQIKIAAAATIAFALMIAFGSHSATDGPLRWFGDLLIWPLGDQVDPTSETQLLAAILGGVMAGFGLLWWMLADALGTTQPALLRRLILVVLSVWFVIDSVGSVAAGAWLNVIGNLGFLAMFVIPALRLPRTAPASG